MMEKSRKPLAILASVCMFVLFYLLLILPLRPSGYVLEEGWRIVGQTGTSREIDLPYLEPLEAEEVVLQVRFPRPAGNVLVIRRPSGNALQVSLNGERIYALGDMQEPTANLWNSLLAVPLLGDLGEDNLLEIRIRSASYDIGLTLPPYIEDSTAAVPRVALANVLFNDLNLISIGAVLIVGIILVVLSFARRPSFGAEFFFGLACFLSGIFSLDYVFRLSSGGLAHFLIFKKTLMISGYLAALSFVGGLEKYACGEMKSTRLLSVPTLISVFGMAAAASMLSLVRMLPYLNIALLLNITAGITIILRKMRSRPVLLIPAVLLILSLLQMVVLTITGLSLPFVLQYVMLASALVFGVSMILEYNQLYRENLELARRVNRDPLTGAFNRNIFSRLNPKLHDILILIDLDNLKQYNDCYGHPEGDTLLVRLTESVRSNLRQNDLVIRYGGDEFVLVLDSASMEDAQRIMLRIRSLFKECIREDWVGFSYGITSVSGSFSESLARADREMYAMKKNKTRPPQPIRTSPASSPRV